jgi:hypothetical protein
LTSSNKMLLNRSHTPLTLRACSQINEKDRLLISTLINARITVIFKLSWLFSQLVFKTLEANFVIHYLLTFLRCTVERVEVS